MFFRDVNTVQWPKLHLFQKGSDVLGVFFLFLFAVALLTTSKQKEHFEKRRLFVSHFFGIFTVMEKNVETNFNCLLKFRGGTTSTGAYTPSSRI